MDCGPHTFRRYERRPFDAERCTECARCLTECPVMHLPEPEAVARVRALKRYAADPEYTDATAERVLRACTSCFACNVICPEDCRPANLFLDLWYRAYQREGLPARAQYFLPHSLENFRTFAMDRFPPEFKEAVESWKSTEPAAEVFYTGCNLIATPYLTFSRLFDGLAIRGGLEYCCGEMYFRMGLYDQVEEIARKLTAYFRAIGARKVYGLCTACLNVLDNVLPQFGADFTGIEFVPYLKVIHGRLASGELPLVKRFEGRTITIQDSCHAKIFEEGYADWPRRILELLGFTILEAAQHGDTALCCGIGSGFSHDAAYGKLDMIRGQRQCTKNLNDAGADCIGVYCSGCLQTLSTAKYVAWSPRPIYHVIELIQEAIGETPRRAQGRLARHLLEGTVLRQRIAGRRFSPPPIE